MHATSALCALAAAASLAGQPHPNHAGTFLGGPGGLSGEEVRAVAVAANGDLVVAGRTDAPGFPVTAGAFDTSFGGGEDAFVARLSPDCSQLIACTFLGGTSLDVAAFVHVGGDGSIWVGGTTSSPDFPTTPDAFGAHHGSRDAFVARFDASLSSMGYGTAFGNPSTLFSGDTGDDFAIDEGNRLVYVFGTTSRSWVLPPSAIQSAVRGSSDFYVAVLDLGQQGRTSLAYGTLLGGSSEERNPGSLTLEPNGVVTLSGGTVSTDFPITPGAFRTTNPSAGTSTTSIAIARIDTSPQAATRLLYGSYFGGTGTDRHVRHATDAAGVVHMLVTGNSRDLPLTANALITTPGVNDDAYYAQLDPARSGAAAMRFGSWILVSGSESYGEMALGNGKVAFVLETRGFGHQTTPGAFMLSTLGGITSFVLELDIGSRPDPFVTYASCYGTGRNVCRTRALAYDGAEVVVGGYADHLDPPLSRDAAQRQNAGGFDGFAGRLELQPWPSALVSFGTGCAGSAGTPQLTATSPARLGHRLALTASALPSFGLGFLNIGVDTRQLGGLPLPLDLGLIGAPGCTLLVAPVLTQVRRATTSGEATLDLPIPIDPRLPYQSVFVQYAQLDAAANALGLTTSNGIGAEVRW